MDRRKALQNVGLLMGTTLISTELFLLTGCDRPLKQGRAMSATLSNYESLISSIGDTMLPATAKHSGFKAINNMKTVMDILNDCYKSEDIKIIADGLKRFNEETIKSNSKSFQELDSDTKTKVLSALDKKYFDKSTPEAEKPKFYGFVKEALLLTYFTDKKVMEGTFSHKKVPGKYDGNMKIEKDQYMTIYSLGV